MNTSAFYLGGSLMCVGELHAVCPQSTDSGYLYTYLFTCFWCSFMEVMSSVITLRTTAGLSLQFVQKCALLVK